MINMEGRTGEKLAFSRLELCTFIKGMINKNILPVKLIIISKLDIICNFIPTKKNNNYKHI